MKCVRNALILAAAVMIISGCASNKADTTPGVDSDSYEDSVLMDDDEVTDVDEVYQLDSGNKSSSKKGSKEKVTATSIIQNFFGSKYVDIDDGSVFVTKTFGGIKQNACTYVAYPATNTAGFGSNYMASYYYLTMDDVNRHLLFSSIEKYFKDFENKKLKRDDRKSYKAYGKINVFLRWGTVKGNSPYYSEKVPVYLGYKFVDNSPYFTITMNEKVPGNTYDIIKDVDDVIYSVYLNYYFTKAQCNMLTESISDEKLAQILNKFELDETGKFQENDSYDE